MLSLKNMQKSASFVSIFAVILLCATGIFFLQRSRLQPQDSLLTKADYLKQEKATKMELRLFKSVPSFGFNNIIADWLYLQFIQYFGDGEARQKVGYSLSPDYFETIVDRDPKFIDAHLRLSVATSIFAGEPEKNIINLTKSLQALSPKTYSPNYDAYYLWIYKGMDEMLFLGDNEAAKKSYEMAVKWAEIYNDEESLRVAKRVRQSIEFLSKNPNSKVARIGVWSLVLSSSSDQKTVQRAVEGIRALGGDVTIDAEGRVKISVPED
jgi:hypothetical protein